MSGMGVMDISANRHPVLRVLLLGTPLTGRDRTTLKWPEFYREVLKLRDDGRVAVDWLTDSENHLTTWLQSHDFLRAPAVWPVEVGEAFVRAVSPYEMAGFRDQRAPEMGQALVMAFSHGVSVGMLEELLQLPGPEVRALMADGIREYRKDPRFILWELNLRWEGVVLPKTMAPGLLERLSIRRELSISPLDVPRGRAALLVGSPRFMSYALHVAPKLKGFRPRSLKARTRYYVRPPKEL